MKLLSKRIIKVSEIPVCDVTVTGLENFTLANGLVVHNSKDCISGDTLIPLLNGTTKPIRDLVGTEFWVYSSLPTGRIVPARARNVHKVGTLPVLRITLDSGDTLTCTPDHEIMLRDGSFTEAKDLKEGISLMPFYTKLSEGDNKSSLKGYHQFWCNDIGKFIYTHQRVATEVLNFSYVGTKNTRRVIHHKDINKLNNDPSNFEIMDWNDHWLLHAKLARGNLKKLWADPTYVKMRAEASSKVGKVTGVVNITKYNKSPERIAKLKANGQFVANGKKLAAITKQKWSDPDYRKSQIEKMKIRNGYTRRDIVLDKILETAKNSGSLTEVFEKLRCTQKVVMRVLNEEGVTSSDVLQLCDPLLKKPSWNKHEGLTFDFLKNEATKYGGFYSLCKGLGVTTKVIYARLSKAELLELTKCYDKSKVNRSEHFRNDVTFDSLVTAANNKEKTLFEICTALKIHSTVAERVITSNGYTKEQFKQEYCHLRFNNHKVLSIEYLDNPIDVYDMTVDSTHNFAISSGIFVHNCSDSAAGVMAGLLSRREMWGLYGIAPMEIPDVARKVVKDSKDTEKLQKG